MVWEWNSLGQGVCIWGGGVVKLCHLRAVGRRCHNECRLCDGALIPYGCRFCGGINAERQV